MIRLLFSAADEAVVKGREGKGREGKGREGKVGMCVWIWICMDVDMMA